jgi:[acyl-carrier-protein] S-malonyltransferase
MARAFVFPGQGSQTVGMGAELAEAFPQARYVFEEVCDALGDNLTRLMFEGPEADLTLTENAQPAIMAVSLRLRRRTLPGGVFRPDRCRSAAGRCVCQASSFARPCDAAGRPGW